MIKNIIILTIFALAIFLLNRYYQQSSLNFKGGAVVLEVKGKKVELKPTTVNVTSKEFSNVNIVEKELTIDKAKVYYEEASINGLYEFNHNIKDIIRVLFNAKELKNIFTIRELNAIQITTEGGEVINLFVSDNDTKEFHLFYGFSNELFRSTILTLMGSDKFGFELEKSSALDKSMTDWSVVNNDINGIVSSIDY